jgi:hypothetical protein
LKPHIPDASITSSTARLDSIGDDIRNKKFSFDEGATILSMDKDTRFSTYLFWDVNKDDLDMEKHSQYIIKRVLEYGMLQDWNIVKQYYGLGRIVEIAKGFRELEPRALAYLSAISQTPKEQFRCYTYQRSNPQHWNF